ncbi:MAG: hypothetical protein N2036_00020 [Bryobacteraceae bacterium]|nr:hypothetical protein [Bryobacteraceae bacterium]
MKLPAFPRIREWFPAGGPATRCIPPLVLAAWFAGLTSPLSAASPPRPEWAITMDRAHQRLEGGSWSEA